MAVRGNSLGEVGTLILAALVDGDRHGYAIMAEVADLSDGRVKLGTGTLYGALERLLDAGLVVAAREERVDGRLRRYYHLTDVGHGALTTELDQREAFTRSARRRLAGA